MAKKKTAEQRRADILARIIYGEGCWLWRGYHRKKDGRPILGKAYAYRLVYEVLVGPIPKGLVLDHVVCDNPACVRPDHVAPVPQASNLRRIPSFRGNWTTCIRGHSLDDAVTNNRGQRQCRPCCRERARRYKAARRERERAKV